MSEARIRDGLTKTLSRISSQIDLDALTSAIESGNYTAVENAALGDQDRTRQAIAAVILVGMRDSLEERATEVADGYDVQWAPTEESASWLEDEANKAAVALIYQAKQTISGIIRRGIALGLEPAQIARRIKEWLWVLDRHAAALEAQAQRMEEEGLAEAVIWSNLSRSENKYEAYHITLVASSEDTEANTKGLLLGLLLLIRLGLLGPSEFLLMWWTALDERVCPECGPLHGVTREWDEEFPDGDPPLHGQCRCRLRMVRR